MVRKAKLQYQIHLGILTTWQEGTCTMVQTEFCNVIPKLNFHLVFITWKIKFLHYGILDPLPSLGYILGKWFSSGCPWLKSQIDFNVVVGYTDCVLYHLWRTIVIFAAYPNLLVK